jgi:hypothetical protein
VNLILEQLPSTGDGWFQLAIGVVVVVIVVKLFLRKPKGPGGRH